MTPVLRIFATESRNDQICRNRGRARRAHLGGLGAEPAIPNADFVKHASVGNTLEIEESKLTLDRAIDPRLEAFAQRMITDHSAAEKTLETAAGKDKLKTEPMLDAMHQAMLDNVKTFNGADLDKIYMTDQIQAHAETVALLSDYRVNGKGAALKGWAEKTLPIVKEHKEMIEAM